jgi:hypothetical protein
MIRKMFCLILIVLYGPTVAAQQKAYRAPRLPDGRVDLQGTWSMNDLTPLERPRDISTLVITTEEAERINARDLSKRFDGSVPGDPAENQETRRIQPIRGELHSSVIVDPQDGKIPGNARFKERAAQELKAIVTAFDGPEQRPSSERCILMPNAMTPILSLGALNLHRIVQTASTIVIASEANHDARIVRVGARHPPTTIYSWLGDSVGWWDGDTLVVETTNFSATSTVRQHGQGILLLSPDAKVTERFALVSSDELRYEFTISDPIYYTQEWTGESHFHRSKEQLYEYACHEGNYSLTNALQAARILELDSRAR